MAGQIRITPDEMRSRAVDYTSRREELTTLISNLDTLLATLREEWEGSASEQFDSQWQEIKPGFNNCEQLLDTITAQLNQTAQAMESLDAEIASQMGV
ncbi:WXG100 family type VII secretion target [Mollicutes bacterium LVI A0039]|nr:WXG100 family type VII secretion target [Mollicutes bacterium LVI A0039]